jgi:hypothetical protein
MLEDRVGGIREYSKIRLHRPGLRESIVANPISSNDTSYPLTANTMGRQ